MGAAAVYRQDPTGTVAYSITEDFEGLWIYNYYCYNQSMTKSMTYWKIANLNPQGDPSTYEMPFIDSIRFMLGSRK